MRKIWNFLNKKKLITCIYLSHVLKWSDEIVLLTTPYHDHHPRVYINLKLNLFFLVQKLKQNWGRFQKAKVITIILTNQLGQQWCLQIHGIWSIHIFFTFNLPLSYAPPSRALRTILIFPKIFKAKTAPLSYYNNK